MIEGLKLRTPRTNGGLEHLEIHLQSQERDQVSDVTAKNPVGYSKVLLHNLLTATLVT